MRIKMIFKLERPELDIQYRRAFLSLLKKSFKQASEAVYQKLYETGTAMKPFTFGLGFSCLSRFFQFHYPTVDRFIK